MLCAGCGPKEGSTDAAGTTTGVDDTFGPEVPSGPGEPTTTATTGDSSTTGCVTNGCEAEPFGYVCIDLVRGETLDADPFPATDQILVTMQYQPCLIDYYLEKHPEMRLDGPADQGGAVFAEWMMRLCSEPVDQRIDCSVVSFEQTLAEDSMVFRLTVAYKPTDTAEILGRKLLFGPGPLPASAECDAGELPSVRLLGLGDIVGLDQTANVIWGMESFGSTPTGVFGEPECLQIPITNL